MKPDIAELRKEWEGPLDVAGVFVFATKNIPDLLDEIGRLECRNRHQQARIAVLAKRGTATNEEVENEIHRLNMEEEQCGCFRDEQQAEIERLRWALKEIAALPDVRTDEACLVAIAALAGKEKAQ